MSTIINMQEYIANKQAKEEILPFFRRLNPSFDYYREPFDIAFVLNQQINVVVFLTFVPSNTFTELPNIYDSFDDIRSNPRVSKGEWVVENILELLPEMSFDIMHQLKDTKENPVKYLKKQLAK